MKKTVKALWTLLGVCYIPVYILGHVLYALARLALALAWALMLDGRRARDIIDSLGRRA